MSKKLEDYIKLYENVLDESMCQNVIESITDGKWQKHYYYNPSTDKTITHDDDLSVIMAEDMSIDLLNKIIWESLYRYVVEDLDIEYFNSWTGFSLPRFNKYTEDTRMRLHCDHIRSLFEGPRKGVPILTVLGALNNDFTGGEFFLLDKIVEFPAGSIMIFPSDFLYPHEVRPVKSGIRYTYVSWAW